MTGPAHALLAEVHDYLAQLVERGAHPDEALAGLAPLRARHPEATVELVWEEEAYDGSLHYDALVRIPGDGATPGRTVSISVCPDGELPWPLRGAQRWRDSDLLRVDGFTLGVADAVSQLEVLWESAPLMSRLVDACLLERALAEQPVDVGDAQLQAALDAIRRRRGLLTADDTRRWMASTGMTHAMLEAMAERVARANELRDRVVADRVDAFFAEHGRTFDRLRVAHVTAPSQEELEPYLVAARHGAGPFTAVLGARLGAGSADPVRIVVEVATRGELEQRLCAPLEGAGPGAVVGPVAARDGLALACVLAVEPARLDAATRAAVKAALFDAWLAERRGRARVEWFWGTEQRTAAAAPPRPGAAMPDAAVH